jgi:predicted GNAT family N-acyltransferase
LPGFPIEPFGPQHDRESFCCGNEALDRYFKERIRKDVQAGVAAAFVMANGPSVLGYYTLSAHSMERGTLPAAVVKKLKLPEYPLIPATLMGRLAVDVKYQGQRLGEILLMDGLERSSVHSSQIASFAIVVDAKENAVEFYRRYGFLPLPQGNRMFIPMATVRELLGALAPDTQAEAE